MGHQHLGRLPNTRDWRHVVALISDGALLSSIVAATSTAVERSMIDASEDHTVRHSFFLLTQLPLAARSAKFADALRELGLDVSDRPSPAEIGAAMTEAIDRFTSIAGCRTDYGEIAQLSAVESVQAVLGLEVQDFFDPDHGRVKSCLSALATETNFPRLAREFFARLTRRHLNFFLHRELASHVGGGKRFSSIADHKKFEQELDTYCREASRIIKEFSGQWFVKQNFEGGIDPPKAGRFVHVAAGKIREELRRRGAPSA